MDRYCQECGKPLDVGRRKDAKYCSGRCRASVKRRLDRAEKEKQIFQSKHVSDELLKQFSTLLPDTSKRLQEFIAAHGADCAEAAVKLALAAFMEARKAA